MNEEAKVIETNETVGDVVSTKNSGKKSLVKPALIIVGIGAVVGSIAAIVNKNKDKRKAKRRAKQIKALEKEGYTVIEPEEFVDLVKTDKENETEE